jgi:peptide chain release factor subunit 3
MIMGAALADYGGLVISARKGEYEAGFEKDGQTREHVQLAKSLGVQKLIIIVNKMDDPSVKWDQGRWNEIRTGLLPFLLKTGYKETDLYWVPISGLQGTNLVNRDTMKEVCPWFDGPCFLEVLDQMPVEKRDPNGPLRIPILDKQKDRGIVVHGKVVQGTVRLGDKIALSPHQTSTQVGLILDHKNQSVKYARPGENVQIKLLHISEDNDEIVQKGHVISFRDAIMPASELFEAEIELLELLDFKPIFSRGYQCMLHMHTFADECAIKDILVAEEKDPATGVVTTKENPKFTRSFAKIRARVSTRIPVPLEKFDVVPELGRFTLRDEGKTIAVGRVVRYKPYKVDIEKAASDLAKRKEEAGKL